jgi:hypothetical protein
MSQCANIWCYLKDGNTITPKEAYEKFGTLALHSRIAELRERGHEIHTEMITVNGKQVGRYSMAGIERAA